LAAARHAAAHVIVGDVDAPELADEDSHHLHAVLRIRPGEAVSVTDGAGAWRLCHLRSDGGLSPSGEVVRRSRPSPGITVGFAPVKGDRPDWAVQKLTEVGVDGIVILRTERGVVRWEGERGARHLERMRAVIRQAVMQSRQLWLPRLSGPADFASLVAAPGVAVAAAGGAPPSLEFSTVLVGPEGGWSRCEEASAKAKVDLGPAVLRTETAALTAGILLSGLRAGVVRSADVAEKTDQSRRQS
jgi:16S rRNA (uracil1498-N3)-methyltransferase